MVRSIFVYRKTAQAEQWSVKKTQISCLFMRKKTIKTKVNDNVHAWQCC